MKLEDVLASQSNMTPEFLPAVDANDKGLPQSLIDKRGHQTKSAFLGRISNWPCSIVPSV